MNSHTKSILLWRLREFSQLPLHFHWALYISFSKSRNAFIHEWILHFFSYACLLSDANITPCEKKRRDSIFYSKKFIPFCKPDGSWSEIQCGKSSRDCWCVDSGGNEVPGTRGSNLEICPDFGLYFLPDCIPKWRSSIMSTLKYLVTLTPSGPFLDIGLSPPLDSAKQFDSFSKTTRLTLYWHFEYVIRV